MVANPTLGIGSLVCDVEARVFGDRIYLYGTCGNCGEGVYAFRVYSSEDMLSWTNHGVAFSAKDIAWTKVKGLWAPDCVYKDGKYYLYYSLPAGEMGVAVSDCPYGPFKDLGRVNVSGIDPSVLVDDDGSAYLYWGQLDYVRVAKLKDNMREIDESTITQPLTVKEHGFHEGSSVRKINGKYYYLYTDTHRRGKATAQGYAVSNNPMTGFEYKGVVIDNFECDPKSWNNHGSIQKFKGQWYIFYHRAMKGLHSWGQPRDLCIERIELDEKGEIQEVLPTSSGVAEYLLAQEKIPGYTACAFTGLACIDADKNSQYAYAVKRITPRSSAGYRFVYFDGESEMQVKMKGEGNCRVELYVDGRYYADKSVVLDIFYKDFGLQIPPVYGKHEITLKFFGLFEEASLDEISFVKRVRE